MNEKINIKGKKIALIGGAGFIGHHLALNLSKKEAIPIIIDSLQVNNILTFIAGKKKVPNTPMYINFINERLNLLKSHSVPLIVQDARDYHKLSEVLTEVSPDIIIHLAAVAHANISNKDPFSTFDHSMRTLENALDWARSKVEHFVYFSSSMVYGNFKSEIVTEETPCDPLGVYGALKYAGEKIVIAYNQVFGLPYTIVRPSALYGERCVSRRVAQIFIENAIIGIPIEIQGDGSNKLDFTYIDDLVHGIECVLTHSKAKGEIFNLTYGESRSIKSLANILKGVFPDINIKLKQWDRLTPKRGTLSIEKAKKLINYNPIFPLEKGIPKYIEWYREALSKEPSLKLIELNI